MTRSCQIKKRAVRSGPRLQTTRLQTTWPPTTWPQTTKPPDGGLSFNQLCQERKSGAGEGARTLDPDLGKAVLYQCATPASEMAAIARRPRQLYAKSGP